MNECNFQHGMDFENLIYQSKRIYCDCISKDVIIGGNSGCSDSHLECILQKEQETIACYQIVSYASV